MSPGVEESPAHAGAGSRPSRAGRPALRRVVRLVLAGALLGVVCGFVWEWVWTPPTGAVWSGKWYLDPTGVTQEVGATGWFTVVGALGGVVHGTVAGKVCRGHELATLLGVVLGALLAAWVAYAVGHALGPADPHQLAKQAGDWEQLPGDLRLAGAGLPLPLQEFRPRSSALLAPLVGALLGLVGILFGNGPVAPRTRRHETASR